MADDKHQTAPYFDITGRRVEFSVGASSTTGLPPMKVGDRRYAYVLPVDARAAAALKARGINCVYEEVTYSLKPPEILSALKPQRQHREGKYGPKWGFKR